MRFKISTIAFYPFLALMVLIVFTTAYIAANNKIKDLPHVSIGKNQYNYYNKYLEYYDKFYDDSLKLNILSDNIIFTTALNLNTDCGDYLGIPKVNNKTKDIDECFNRDVFWKTFIKILKDKYLKDYVLYYEFHKNYVEVFGKKSEK